MSGKDEAIVETCKYLYSNPITAFIHNIGHKFAASLVKKNKNGKTLDMGCGKGDHFQYIKSRNFIGIDINKDLLNLAKQEYPNAQLTRADIFNLPFKDNSFDTIVSIYVLEHLANLPVVLREVNRVLRGGGGEFIIAIPTEGVIYKLGRNLTTKRHIEKKYNIDYIALVKEEHLNECRDIIKNLKSIFKVTRIIGLPFLIPVVDLNILMVARCIKERDYEI